MNRFAIALLACVICLFALFAAFGQPAEKPAEKPGPTDGAIVVGQPMPPTLGRYRMQIWEQQSTLIIIDTHTGQCWSRNLNHGKGWRDLGIPREKN